MFRTLPGLLLGSRRNQTIMPFGIRIVTVQVTARLLVTAHRICQGCGHGHAQGKVVNVSIGPVFGCGGSLVQQGQVPLVQSVGGHLKKDL